MPPPRQPKQPSSLAGLEAGLRPVIDSWVERRPGWRYSLTLVRRPPSLVLRFWLDPAWFMRRQSSGTSAEMLDEERQEAANFLNSVAGECFMSLESRVGGATYRLRLPRKEVA